MGFILPPGSGRLDVDQRGSGEIVKVLWGLSRHEWGDIHLWLSVSLLAGAALHLILHWRWIAAMVTAMITRPRADISPRQRRWRATLATLAIAVLATTLLAPWFAPIRELQVPDSVDAPDLAIRGSMTLLQVQMASGMPATALIESLGLPESTSPQTSLSQLRRDQGITVGEVRREIENWANGANERNRDQE
jgi:hypothetical protein